MAAHQAPPSLGFSRQEYWSGLPFPSAMNESENWKWSHSVMSDSLPSHGLQHSRLPCPSSIPGPCSNSSPLTQWCHAAISSTVVPFSSCLQSFSASGSFPVSQFFASGGQRIGVSASPSVLPVNIQGWFILGWTSLISEKAMAPYSSTLVWKIPRMEKLGRLQSMGSLGVRHDWVTSLSIFTFMNWRRKWQPTPVFLPGESQGRRSLVGCCLWGCTESDTT